MRLPDTTAVVVVNFGAHTLLARNLPPLSAAGATVVVVDNFHSPAARAAATELADRHGWELLTPAGNLGFGEGNNLGVDRALALGCSTLILLNPDAEMDPDAAAALQSEVATRPTSLVGPRVVRPDGSIWFRGSRLDLADGRLHSVPDNFATAPHRWLTGACLAVSADWWRELGGFGRDYFLYWEDVDLSWRSVGLGGGVHLAAEVTVVHDAGGTQVSADTGKSPLYYRYNCRNRLLFAGRHLPPRQALRWLVLTPRESVAVLRRAGRRPLLRRPSRVLAGIVGSVQGAGLLGRELLRRRFSSAAGSAAADRRATRAA